MFLKYGWKYISGKGKKTNFQWKEKNIRGSQKVTIMEDRCVTCWTKGWYYLPSSTALRIRWDNVCKYTWQKSDCKNIKTEKNTV